MNDEFIRQSEDEEETDESGVTVQATAPEPVEETEDKPKIAATATDERETPPYTTETPEIKLPPGVGEAQKPKAGGMRRFVIALFLLVAFIAVIGGLFLLRSFSRKDENLEVKSTSTDARKSSAATQTMDADSEAARAVEAAKNAAAASATPVAPGAASATGQPGAPTMQSGSILDQPSAAYPPIIGAQVDPSRPAASGASQRSDSGSSSGGGSSGFSSGGSNNQLSPPPPPSAPVSLPIQSPAPIRIDEAAEHKIAVPNGNGGRTLYFYAKAPGGGGGINNNNAQSPAYKPPFGAILPIRTLGALHTLSSGGLARMELTRAVEGNNWRLPRGTVLVGRVSGGADKRLFVSLIGYIEPGSNQLVELSGDVLGLDGAIGLDGQKKQLQNRWKRIFGDALGKATQLGSAYLLGRRGGSGGISSGGGGFDSIVNQANPFEPPQQETSFIVVGASTAGYIMVNNLPPATQLAGAPAGVGNFGIQSSPVLPPAGRVSDDELLQILTGGSSDDIRNAFPRMSPEWQQIARQMLETLENPR